MLLLPSDHHIGDVPSFLAAIETAGRAARRGALATFGMTAIAPETGYGYIRQGAPVPGLDGCWEVERFVEKPDFETARAFVADGRHVWNSGMVLFKAAALVAELGLHAPEVLEAARRAVAGASSDLDFLRLEAAAFAAAPSISIDHAVMEKTGRAVVVPAEMGWTDVGSWGALWDAACRDGAGNALHGDVVALDCRNSYVRADGRLVAVLGMDDVVVVDTADALLVAPRARAQEVKQVADRLKASGRAEAAEHVRVHRPWGCYEGVDAGAGFQVKRLTVNPGGRLSLQKHGQRAEHWVVVSGIATVTRGDEEFELTANQSTYIPRGCVHRLENRTAEPVRVIEVQSGEYLGEDDILRLDDQYGRA